MGRPPTAPITFKNGFYIEVRTKGSSSGVKIHCDELESMNASAAEYKKYKDVIILGEIKDGKWLTKQPGATYKTFAKGRRK